MRIFAKLDELSYEQYKRIKKVESEEEMEDLSPERIEEEVINFLKENGGESTLEEIRNVLGEEFAAYARGPMKDKKVRLEGNKVKLMRG